jgi:hypothetical protein
VFLPRRADAEAGVVEVDHGLKVGARAPREITGRALLRHHIGHLHDPRLHGDDRPFGGPGRASPERTGRAPPATPRPRGRTTHCRSARPRDAACRAGAGCPARPRSAPARTARAFTPDASKMTATAIVACYSLHCMAVGEAASTSAKAEPSCRPAHLVLLSQQCLGSRVQPFVAQLIRVAAVLAEGAHALRGCRQLRDLISPGHGRVRPRCR